MGNDIIKNNFKKRRKLIFIIIALMLSLLLSGIFMFYLLKYARRSSAYQQALDAFNAQDYAQAETMLLACIREDRNNEAVWEKLAIINKQKKHWRNASECFRMLLGLNQQEKRYFDGYVESLFQAQAYKELIALLQPLPDESKKNYAEILALAYLINNQDEEASKVLALQKNALEPNDRRRLADWYAQIKNQKIVSSENLTQLDKLTCSADSAVAFFAISLKAMKAANEKSAAASEKYLLQLVQINPELAVPLLGNFYYKEQRYSDAVNIYKTAEKNNLPYESILCYLESLFFLGDRAALQKTALEIPQKNRNALLCRLYAEALLAYMDGDIAALGAKLIPLNNWVRTPLALIIQFDYAWQSRNIDMLQAVLKIIAEQDNLAAFYEASMPKVDALLLEFYNAGRIVEIAPLAKWLSLSRRNNLLITRIVLLNQSQEDNVELYELERSLKIFPDDPVILTIGADQYNRKGDYLKAWKAADHNRKIGNDSLQVNLQIAHALEGLAKIAEARSLYTKLRSDYPDDLVLLKHQIAFVLRHNESLPEVSDALASQKPLAELLEGEAARRQNQFGKMVELFGAPELLDSLDVNQKENLPLLFYIAMRLGEADALDAAIGIYEKLKPSVADKLLIHLNLAELYAAQGNKQFALNEARNAWMTDPHNEATNSCYGLRQLESGYWSEAVTMLTPWVVENPADGRIIPAWREAVSKLLVKEFELKNYLKCLELSRLLLAKYPDDATALEYAAKAQNKIDAESKSQE